MELSPSRSGGRVSSCVEGPSQSLCPRCVSDGWGGAAAFVPGLAGGATSGDTFVTDHRATFLKSSSL